MTRPLLPFYAGLLAAVLSSGCGFDGGVDPPSAPTCTDGVKNAAETDIDCGSVCGPCDDGKACASAPDCGSGRCEGGHCAAPSCDDGIVNGAETDADCGGEACPPCAEGEHCIAAADCATETCVGGACIVPTCTDGYRDGAESDVDCGGGTCPVCKIGQSCSQGESCESGVCAGKLCVAPTCGDGVENGTETSVDCGGGCPCPDGTPCTLPTECLSLVCGASGTCQPATCGDGVQNGSEGDVDCGGGCPKCADGHACGGAADCTSGVCTDAICQPPRCSDQVENGGEIDVDCGGVVCAPCGDGKTCAAASDCESGVCTGNPKKCATSCADAVKNGTETDVDCGGGCPVACGDGNACVAASDCESGVCDLALCQPPTCADAAQNGSEPDVDCGGGCPAKCNDGKACASGGDCKSGVCAQAICQAPSCSDGAANGAETDADCGGPCATCPNGASCAIAADCTSGACVGGACAPWSKGFAATQKFGQETAVDGTGNVLATSFQYLPTDVGGPSSLWGLIVVKYDAKGNYVWSKAYGAPDAGQRAIAVDTAGSVVFATPPTNGASYGGAALTVAGGYDVGVVKLTPQGVHVWSHAYGGIGDEQASSMAVDGSGDILLVGAFTSPVLDFGGGVTLAHGPGAGTTAFVAKLDGDSGATLWAKAFGGTATGGIDLATANSVAVDAAGNVVVTGLYFGAVDFGGGTLSNPGGTSAAFVAKLAGSTGAHLWSRSFGGSSGWGIAVDATGSVVFTGSAYGGSDFGGGPLSAGPENLDVFLVKLWGLDGGHVWSRMFPGTSITGPSREIPPTVTTDAAGNAFVAGGFSQSTAVFGAKTVANPFPGSLDAFVASFDGATGTVLSAKAFGGPNDDWIDGLAVDRITGNVLVAGSFSQSIDLGDGPHAVASPFGFFLASVGSLP